MGERAKESALIIELTAQRDAAIASYEVARDACRRKDRLMQLALSAISESRRIPRPLRWALASGTVDMVEYIINLEWGPAYNKGRV